MILVQYRRGNVTVKRASTHWGLEYQSCRGIRREACNASECPPTVAEKLKRLPSRASRRVERRLDCPSIYKPVGRLRFLAERQFK